MSEKMRMYLVGNQIVIEDFTHLSIDGEDYTCSSDKVVLNRIRSDWEYSVTAYKDSTEVWQLPEDRVVDAVYYEKSSWDVSTYYEIETKKRA